MNSSVRKIGRSGSCEKNILNPEIPWMGAADSDITKIRPTGSQTSKNESTIYEPDDGLEVERYWIELFVGSGSG